jgi:multisubunit Na+/H+ antiporter MnhG subunit
MAESSTTPCQTTWADFAVELLAFARQEPFTFGGVSAALAVMTLLAIFFLWLMLPKASHSVAQAVQTARDGGSANGVQQELFDNDDAA